MLHGPDISGKYSVIIDAYRYELMQGVASPAEYEAKTDTLVAFKDQLVHGTIEEFNEYYQLYKDAPRQEPPTRRKDKP